MSQSANNKSKMSSVLALLGAAALLTHSTADAKLKVISPESLSSQFLGKSCQLHFAQSN